MQRRNTTQRLSVIIGITLAVLMAVTLFLPALVPDQQPQFVEPPTATPIPVPTFPPPLTDFSGITFDQDFLHPSGLYAIGVPTGWTPNAPLTNEFQPQVTMSNPERVSVIETYILEPDEPVTSAEQVSARFDQATLSASWRNYTSWTELSRRTENDRLLIDFSLSRGAQQFLARHAAWTDGTWIYVVRVVVPQNAREMMFFLLDAMTAQFQPNAQFMNTPVNWRAYFDEMTHHVFRHPADWQLVDGGFGVPASFRAPDGTLMRVETQSQTVADEAGARAWVENLRSGNQVISVEPVTRPESEGFAVSYSFTDPDGERQSGKAVLLNGPDGQLHVANALLPVGGVDLNTEEGRAAYSEVATVLDTFSMLTGLRRPAPEVIEEAQPEVTPEVEDVEDTEEPVTGEATPEVEAPEAEVTSEAEGE